METAAVVDSGCLLQQLTVTGDVVALGQLGQRNVGGDDADEQRKEARRQRLLPDT